MTSLIAFIISEPLRIVPASSRREWMDRFSERHPYRCLPLTIANACGWDLLCPEAFEAGWNGDPSPKGIYSSADHIANGHFGGGILTFHTRAIFRTDLGTNLLVTGPWNTAKPNLHPLTGIVETDWAPFTFTMNYRFLHPGFTRFARDEPFCTILPINLQNIESILPRQSPIVDNPGLNSAYLSWSAARDKFNTSLPIPGTPAHRAKWQRHYYQGKRLDGAQAKSHRTKLTLLEFTNVK